MTIVYTEVEIDIEDYEDAVVKTFCNKNCLKDITTVSGKISNYINELFMDVCVYNKTRDIKLVAEELERLARYAV